MTDVKQAIKSARLPEKSVPLCLRGDLVADYEAAEREMLEAERAAGDSLAGGPAAELSQRLAALRAEMHEHTVAFRVRAMPRKRWRAFLEEHPPRKLDDGSIHPDDAAGVNEQTFYDALCRRSVVSPLLDDEDWSALLDEDGVLSDRQFGALWGAAWAVNRHDVDVPFSPAASPPTPSSAPGSRPRSG